MRIDLYHSFRRLLLWIQLRKVLEGVRMRADRCRECDHEVRFGDTICAYCGARSPVHLPSWVYTIIIGFGVMNVVDMAGRWLGAAGAAAL